MVKVRRLPSGRWNARVQCGVVDGKTIYKSITTDTRAQCEVQAAKYIADHKIRTAEPTTVRSVLAKYISLAEGLSPTTQAGYKTILAFGFQDIMDADIYALTDADVQSAINREARRVVARGNVISPKTVSNEWRLIATAIKEETGLTFKVRLPQRQPHIKDYPDPQEVFKALQGTEIELPGMLALWLSFSMSEIRGLMYSDIKDGYITINRVVVDVGYGTPVVKDNAKVDTRLRRHKIPPYIMNLIENEQLYQEYKKSGKNGYLVPYAYTYIRSRWRTICNHHGWQLTFHDLRHLNASVMLMLGVPEKYAMERGGWKSPNIMKSVYQHTFSTERMVVDNLVNSYFEKLV